MYKIYDHIKPVKGYLRTMLLDVNNHKYVFIPNNILNKNNIYINDNNYITYKKATGISLDPDYIVLIDPKDEVNFIKSNYKWNNPFDITNAIIDIGDKKIDDNIYRDKLNNISVMHIQLRFISNCDMDYLLYLVNFFNNIAIRSIQIVLNYEIKENIDNYYKLINIDKVTKIEIFNYNEDKIDRYVNPYKIIYFYKRGLDINECGKIGIEYFTLCQNHYYESLEYNTCLNRKLSINQDGYVCNCPSASITYDHISKCNIRSLINKNSFNNCWYLSKDKIFVCKDCEFRHICTDCRVFIAEKSIIYSHPTKCTYNPYIAKWKDEDGYISVCEIGEYVNGKFILNKHKINNINALNWKEEV